MRDGRAGRGWNKGAMEGWEGGNEEWREGRDGGEGRREVGMWGRREEW